MLTPLSQSWPNVSSSAACADPGSCREGSVENTPCPPSDLHAGCWLTNELRTCPTPTSTHTGCPCCPTRPTCSMPWARRTVWHNCCAQYEGSVACSSVSQVPVTLEIKGLLGACSSTLPTRAVRVSCRGASMLQCQACRVSTRRCSTSNSCRRSSTCSMASRGPASTQVEGALTAANSTRSSR